MSINNTTFYMYNTIIRGISMEITSIDIKNYFYYCGTAYDIDGVVHTKQLDSLSIVQSKIGSYGIKIGNSAEYRTGEGGIFIAPSLVTQKITHHINQRSHDFKMRFILLDVRINHKYRIDDLFRFPITANQAATDKFDQDFDIYDSADTLCDRMSCIYQIIKHLLEISQEKAFPESEKLYPLINYISKNYMKNITIHDMAKRMNMSESNLFAVFKRAFGTSPVKYLNNYRLSIACDYLLHSDESIQTICSSVGIADPLYFSKMFKAKYALSPQQYRKATDVFY